MDVLEGAEEVEGEGLSPVPKRTHQQMQQQFATENTNRRSSNTFSKGSLSRYLEQQTQQP